MENQYKKLNNIIGWVIFLIASMVYISTSEPTASFWDCGEYISTAYKLQVGHPPGAPLFQLLGRFFTLFAFGNVKNVAFMINIMSALCSGFTILFLFWTITALSKKIILKKNEFNKARIIAVLGSGVVGALAYTFSDSFWFSAVEGEVYAMSSFFTAIVFWAILKWESSDFDKNANRWLLLIAYLVGLSIGVHLLNLLAIPAITFVYYFKKTEKPNAWGIIKTFIISILLLAVVMYIIIPWIVKLSGYFELFFVNVLKFPFNTGTIIYFILLIGFIVWLLYFSHKHKKYILNIITLSFMFILIGYSSFVVLVIRANADTPINENNPDNAINLLSYLNREQYGDWPLLFGQYYNAPVVEYKDGKPVYSKDVKSKKYIITDSRKYTIPKFDPRFETIFPRMWNNSQARYSSNYKSWADVKGHPVYNPDGTAVKDSNGEIIYKPTFFENLKFFFVYQLDYMYFRYFMWNFAGRQNDIQGFGDILDGNWISGINFIDELRLGPQYNIPDSKKNRGNNKFYFLPLILGLIGLFYHAKKNNKDCFIIFLLFFMTGIAIVIYLNQHAFQPRERDYAFAASFYAFSIWIGIGVLSLFEFLSKKIKPEYSAFIVGGLCLVLVPGIMAQQGWDDHNRSGKYTCIDFASNYLNSCEKNAILFTNGDNDTFPLWYAQEVEGIRTDVRIVNLSLLGGDWYINQLRKKVYNTEAVPFTLNKENYRAGNRDVIYLIEQKNIKDYVDVNDILNIIKKDDKKLKFKTEYGMLDYFPTKKFSISVDSAEIIDNKILGIADADKIVKSVDWKINRSAIQKSGLMVLDFIATNKWERPVYFAVTTGEDSYLGLSDYFQLEGLAYKLVPLKTTKSIDGQIGRVNTSVMYDNFMNKFKWGGIKNPDVYIDETTRRMSMNLRNNFARLANALVYENKNDSAVSVCDRCLEVIPEEKITYDYFSLPFVEIYYKAGAKDKADALVKRFLEINDQELNYYFSFKKQKAKFVFSEKQQCLGILQRIKMITEEYNPKLAKEADEIFNKYYNYFVNTIR